MCALMCYYHWDATVCCVDCVTEFTMTW